MASKRTPKTVHTRTKLCAVMSAVRVVPQSLTLPLAAAVKHWQAAGTKGKRYAMKNTRIMMTQPMGEARGEQQLGVVCVRVCGWGRA